MTNKHRSKVAPDRSISANGDKQNAGRDNLISDDIDGWHSSFAYPSI